MQDIFAVVFLVFTAGKVPSLWAFALFGLLLVRPLLFFIIERSGHGELLVLLGWLLPVAGMALVVLAMADYRANWNAVAGAPAL